MRIKAEATAYDTFNCPKYPDLSAIPYKMCLGRQIAKTPRGKWLYSECAECAPGKIVIERFKDYKPVKQQKQSCDMGGEIGDAEKKERALSCVKCKALIHARLVEICEFVIDRNCSQAIEATEELMRAI